MTVVTPPLFQTIDSTYTGASLGLPFKDIFSEGVLTQTDLAVSQRGAGANMSVDVASGVAWVKGDTSVLQPTYRCYNDATVNLAVSAADATKPRIDMVVAEVRDAAFSGVSTDWRLRVIAGTATTGANLTNRTGAAALPDSCLWLADILVDAAATSIVTAKIGDKRALSGAGPGLQPEYVTSLPVNPYDGQEVYYAADATNGVMWHLRYRAAASGSYKWEFVGGPPLSSYVATQESTTSTSYTNLTTSGPTVTLPLAGDYWVETGVSAQAPANAEAAMSYAIGGTGAAAADRVKIYGGSATTGPLEGHVFRRKKQTGMTASTVLLAKYATSFGSGTTYFEHRHMAITPVRVG